MTCHCDSCLLFAEQDKQTFICEECNEVTKKLLACKLCIHCCKHHTCEYCGYHTMDDNWCDDCGHCMDCCNCNSCASCSEEIECRECDCCSGCCNCGLSESSRYGNPMHADHPNDRRQFNCARLVGVEWEYVFNTNFKSISQWAEAYSGLIQRDSSCGREAITSPMAGDHIANSLTALSKAFYNSNTEFNRECSVHVHIDARDASWDDMFRLLWVYAKVEAVLYAIGGQFRAQNDYCKPIGQEYRKALSQLDRKGAVLAVAFGLAGDDDKINSESGRKHIRDQHQKKSDGRYRGLNICPWLTGRRYQTRRSDSTVENRIHRDSSDPLRVIGWAQVNARLVDWAFKVSDKEAQNLPKSGLRALCIIAPDCKDWILSRIKEWRHATSSANGSRSIHVKNGEWSL